VLPGRAAGLHLSPEGVKQAEMVAERVGRLARVGAVYCSPRERARETAGPIARVRGLEPQVEPGLDELDNGEWTGKKLRDLYRMPEWKAVQRYPSGFRFPGGEAFTEMQTRVSRALAGIVARHPGTTVVAVSHGDPIKGAVALALGTPLDLFQRIVVTPASVSAIAYGPGGPTVLTVNSVGGDLPALGLK
jgi:probable phosphoglycerate mutase